MAGLTPEDIDKMLMEDPDDRQIRLAHGIPFGTDFEDMDELCRYGCGETYFEIVVGKRRTCSAAPAQDV